ncbi:unnamed protein product [Amoebophrya sp. A25]|nr:unnamed protein product [Amoebophrya sp. A25]|eukprot:GSA25T00001963001.1
MSAATFTSFSGGAAKPLTIDRICAGASLVGTAPSGLKISPDGGAITYLQGRPDAKHFKDLWIREFKSGTTEPRILVNGDPLDASEADLSNEEKARRERMRVGDARGILDYFWSEDGKFVVCPAADGCRIWLYNVKAESGKMVALGEGVTDTKLSPKGNFICFIRNQNLFVYCLSAAEKGDQETSSTGGAASSSIKQLTFDTEAHVKNGMAEFVAQEEMHRMDGYWWSPDEKFIAFMRVDESPVELVQRNEIYAEGVRMTEQRYPYAGARNARVELAVAFVPAPAQEEDASGKVSSSSPRIVYIPTTPETGSSVVLGCKTAEEILAATGDFDYYLPRVKWLCGSSLLSFQWQSRDQKVLEVRVVQLRGIISASPGGRGSSPQAANGASSSDRRLADFLVKSTSPDLAREYIPPSEVRTLLREENIDTYVNLGMDGELAFCSDKKTFLWCSEAGTGFKGIYVGDYSEFLDEKTGSVIPGSRTGAAQNWETKLVPKESSSRIGSLFSAVSLQHVPHVPASFGDKMVAVDSLDYFDVKNKCIYYSLRTPGPRVDKHLFRTTFGSDSNFVEQLTSKPGWHTTIFGESKGNEEPSAEVENESSSSKAVLFFDHFSSLAQPPQCSLWEVPATLNISETNLSPASLKSWLAENKVEDLAVSEYYANLTTDAEFGSFPAVDDPSCEIFYRVFFPKADAPVPPVVASSNSSSSANGGGKKLRPVVVFVYGGPHVQLCVTGTRWSDQHFFLLFLLQQGYVVFTVDNRGSAGRGHRFENSVYRDMGNKEIADQVRGVEVLCERYPDVVDPARVAVYGHSYGGYMTLHCTLRAYREGKSASYVSYNEARKAEKDIEAGQTATVATSSSQRIPLFKCGVSGAPVTTWRLYDTHYTERYMGVPKSDLFQAAGSTNFYNEAGYESSSVLPFVSFYDDAKSHLFVYHGMADDNVLFQNSTQLYDRMIKKAKVYRSIDYPGAKHSMNGEACKRHLYKTILNFLQQEL